MKKRLYLWVALSPLVLGLLITILIFTVLKSLPAKLPLFYSLAWGENQLATHNEFLIIPAGIGAVTLINLVISWQLHSSQSFFKKTLFIASVIVSLILTIAFTKIVLNFI